MLEAESMEELDICGLESWQITAKVLLNHMTVQNFKFWFCLCQMLTHDWSSACSKWNPIKVSMSHVCRFWARSKGLCFHILNFFWMLHGTPISDCAPSRWISQLSKNSSHWSLVLIYSFKFHSSIYFMI